MTDSSHDIRKRFGSRCLLVVLSVFFLAACTAQYPLNPKVEQIDRETPYRMKLADRDRDDSLLLILAFSGGGTRAASLSYGVLEALDLVEVPPPESGKGQRHTMLDEVDLISSVSGGSFTAAYYGLHGRDIFNDFPREFLYEDYQGALLWGFMNPVNWVYLSSPRFGRSDLAQEYYDDRLFKGATMGDIAKTARACHQYPRHRGHRRNQLQLHAEPVCPDLFRFRQVPRCPGGGRLGGIPGRFFSGRPEKLFGHLYHPGAEMDGERPGQTGYLQPGLLQCPKDEVPTSIPRENPTST